MMRAVDLIAKKRDGAAHTEEEIEFLVRGYKQGAVPDYQMSAWLMAVLWRGLSEKETFALTRAMVASGETLDLSGLTGAPLDKHSTGGVGDKTSLAVVPILASAGVPVAKMSGRGLGHTGGTLDKLEAIPGTRTQLTVPEILAQVRRIGACLCAQTETLVPADRMLYALRDATGTVESLPLIAASIMSKKIAGGSRAVVLDVKVGGGAFMKSLSQARALAALMIRIGQAQGQRVVAVLSDMDEPLGCAIGNRLEVAEVVQLLQHPDDADARLRSLVIHLAAVGFVLAGKAAAVTEGQSLADAQIRNGMALAKLEQIIRAQGGSPDALFAPVTASFQVPVPLDKTGVITGIDAHVLGFAAMRLGAGRATKEDTVRPNAGIFINRVVGDTVTSRQSVATLFAEEAGDIQPVISLVADAFKVAPQPVSATPLIYETLGLADA